MCQDSLNMMTKIIQVLVMSKQSEKKLELDEKAPS